MKDSTTSSGQPNIRKNYSEIQAEMMFTAITRQNMIWIFLNLLKLSINDVYIYRFYEFIIKACKILGKLEISCAIPSNTFLRIPKFIYQKVQILPWSR